MKRIAVALLLLAWASVGHAEITNFTGFEVCANEYNMMEGLGPTTCTLSFTGRGTMTPAYIRTGTGALGPTVTSSGDCYSVLVYYQFTATGAVDTSAQTPGYIRFYFLWTNKPSSGARGIALIGNVDVHLNSDGKIYVDDGISPKTGTTVLASATWYRIEVKVIAAGWEVKINGTSELSAAVDARGTLVNYWTLGPRDGDDVWPLEGSFDDVARSDTDYPGPGQSTKLALNADGTYTAWVDGDGGGGGGYTDCYEECHDDLTTYVKTSDDPNAETYNATDCASSSPVVSGTINAVKGGVWANKAAGTTLNFHVRTRSGTTDTNLTDVDLTTGWLEYQKVHVTDPATSAAWTTSGVDNFQIGVVHNQSQSRQANFTQAYVTVDYQPPSSTRNSVMWFGGGK